MPYFKNKYVTHAEIKYCTRYAYKKIRRFAHSLTVYVLVQCGLEKTPVKDKKPAVKDYLDPFNPLIGDVVIKMMKEKLKNRINRYFQRYSQDENVDFTNPMTTASEIFGRSFANAYEPDSFLYFLAVLMGLTVRSRKSSSKFKPEEAECIIVEVLLSYLKAGTFDEPYDFEELLERSTEFLKNPMLVDEIFKKLNYII